MRTRVAEIAKARRRAQDLQGSLVAIDPASGDVLALVGGRDFGESSFNRATQARRQAGSAFKPIIYAAALERGYAPGSVLTDLDTPIYASGRMWLPVGEHEASQYTLRKALKVSSNRAAAQLLQHVGVGTAVDYAHRFGIDSDLPSVPSLALGTGEVTLLELTAAYGVFANQGLLAAPRLVSRVEDAEGRVIWSAPITTTRAISQTTAFLMSSMLADVVSSGTATGARAAGFKLPAGGKTGTTDDYADAWFVGYTPHLVAGVWFGFDTPAPIMSRGFASTVAVPAWARFMKAATMGARPDWYAVPADVEKVAICRLTGARATEGCRHVSLAGARIRRAPTMRWQTSDSVRGRLRLRRCQARRPSRTSTRITFRLARSRPSCARCTAPLAEPPSSTSGVSFPPSYPPRPIVIERVLRSDGTTAIGIKGGGH